MQSTPHCLYIEDHPASRRVMMLLLKDIMGFDKVTLFETTADLVQQLEMLDQPVDVIFTDLNINPIDGYDVCTVLREQTAYQTIPIVGVTANITPTEIRRMQTIGFTGVITKPLDHATFPSLIKRILDGESVWEA